MEKRFHALSHIHNVLVKHAKKLLRKLERDKEYQALRTDYCALLQKKKLSPEDKRRKTALSPQMKGIRQSLGLTEYDFQAYIKVCGRRCRSCLL